MKKILLPAVTALLMTGAADAAKGISPNEVLKVAQSVGNAKISTEGGDTVVIGDIKGNKYGVFFDDCTAGKDCQSITFWSLWDGTDMDTINQWNVEKLAGRAYLDEDGDANLEMWVNTFGGRTAEQLKDDFAWWASLMKGFQDYIY